MWLANVPEKNEVSVRDTPNRIKTDKSAIIAIVYNRNEIAKNNLTRNVLLCTIEQKEPA